MSGLPWYSGARGPLAALNLGARMLDDLETLRSGFRWGQPRPRSWPEMGAGVPERVSDLSWARQEPVRALRYLIQRGLSMPVVDAMSHPEVSGREWVEDLERPVIFAANHVSHADTPLLLGALSDRVRERTVVAAAADYFYKHAFMGRLMSLWLNTFPFSRTGGAQAVLHSSSQLLKSGWNLVVYPEGTRSEDGVMGEFRPGVGHLATENRAPVIPVHVGGTHRILPKGRKLPVPGKASVRIGKPLTPGRGEGSREFTARVEKAVRSLGSGRPEPEVRGTWIERWRAGGGRQA